MRSLKKSYPVSHLSAHVRGELIGDPNLLISELRSLDTVQPHSITFIRASSPDAISRELSKLSADVAVLVPTHSSATSTEAKGPTVIAVPDAYAAFLDLIPLFYEEIKTAPGIHPSAVIDPSAKIDASASIGAYCVVGARAVIGKGSSLRSHVRLDEDVSIGDGVTLHSGVSLRAGTLIKDRVTIHDNTVIGADGFGYTPDPKVGLRKVPQLGNVMIESDVEIGANTCIDRGAFGPTTIGRGTKIDNLVQIGHNVSIGSFCIICGNAAIGGSTRIEDRVVIGGKVGIADHLIISTGVRVGGGSGVTSSLTESGDYMGFPTIKAGEWRRIQVHLRRLARLKKGE